SYEVVCIGHEQLVLRIKRISTPCHTAKISWHHQRALQTGRSENTLISQLLHQIAASLAILACRSPSFVGGHGLTGQRGWLNRNRLGGRGVFTRDIASRHCSFFNWPNRLTGIAV